MSDALLSKIDWFLKYSKENQVTILLILIISFTYWNIRDINSEYKEVESKYKLLLDKNIELERQLSKINAEVLVFKASTDYFPFPYWIKNTKGEMIYVSRAYEKKYLLPRGLRASDYIGNTDVAIWGVDIGNQYIKNDNLVYSLDRAITFQEPIGNGTILVTKFPYRVGTTVIGIAGVEYQLFKNEME